MGILITLLILTVLLALFFWAGGSQFVGELTLKLFPTNHLQKGDKAHIFLDGVYNRTATICRVTVDSFYIYDRFPMPITYRGSFYAIGTDGSITITYVGDKKHYRLIRIAEKIRKSLHVESDYDNLVPDDSQEDPINEPGEEAEL